MSMTLSEHPATAWPVKDSVSYTTVMRDALKASIYWPPFCYAVVLVCCTSTNVSEHPATAWPAKILASHATIMHDSSTASIYIYIYT